MNFADGSVQPGAGQEVFHPAVAGHLRALPHQVHSLRRLPRELLTKPARKQLELSSEIDEKEELIFLTQSIHNATETKIILKMNFTEDRIGSIIHEFHLLIVLPPPQTGYICIYILFAPPPASNSCQVVNNNIIYEPEIY